MDQSPRGFCIQCGYALQGLAADSVSGGYRCPECGRAFDPNNPKTFRPHQHNRFMRWLGKPVGWPAVVVSVVAAGAVIAVSRWKWNTFRPSVIDFNRYLAKDVILHRTGLLTVSDYVYTYGMVLAGAAVVWWILSGTAGIAARWFMGSHAEDRPVEYGRRYALLAIASVVTSMGALLGWPYRLAQEWVATRLASMQATPSRFFRPSKSLPEVLTAEQLQAILRAGVMQLPSVEQRLGGLGVLMEEHSDLALKILKEAVVAEADSGVRAAELRLIGLHRDVASLDTLVKFSSHRDLATRVAAIDAIGLLHAPAYEVPQDEDYPFSSSGTVLMQGAAQISLITLLNSTNRRTEGPPRLSRETIDLPASVRSALEQAMLTAADFPEREAAARALIAWPPAGYKLRVAEWGVWINSDGELKLAQSVIDEIPPFVHRMGNTLDEFSDRINQVFVITKPIVHLTVDRPMSVDVNVMINQGRPWFAYPRPDDFSVTTEMMNSRPSVATPPGASGPLTTLLPLENPKLAKLTDLRQGYPWMLPAHPGSGGYSGWMGSANVLTSLGLRWQSLVVSPAKLPWMAPPAVPNDPKFAWWEQLRDVPSAWVSSRGESERFLYYDGPTLAPVPGDAKLVGERLSWSISEAALNFFSPDRSSNPPPKKVPPPQGVLLIRRIKGALSGQMVSIPESVRPGDRSDRTAPTTVPVNLPPDDLHGDEVVAAFGKLLLAAGLTAEEAAGLVRAWTPQFFQTDGRRIVMLMARAAYDTFCPIQIHPTPTELVRVGIVLTEFA